MQSGTPMTPIPTLPTISEAKGTEHGGSSAGSSESGDSKNDKRKARPNADVDKPGKAISKKKQKYLIPKIPAVTLLRLYYVECIEHNWPIVCSPKPLKNPTLPTYTFSTEDADVVKMPRNASQPAFTTHVSGLPKNPSVPFFDRIRKTSQGERFRPTLQPIHQNSSRGNVTSNGDLRKSLHLKLSTSSFADSNKNNNFDDDVSQSLLLSRNIPVAAFTLYTYWFIQRLIIKNRRWSASLTRDKIGIFESVQIASSRGENIFY